MAYISAPDFKEPGDDTVIWRYVDFPKFVSMLQSQALYFGSAAKMSDPYEGSIPALDREIKVEDLAARSGFPVEVMILNSGLERREALKMRTSVFLNCWHMNPGESAGMWAQYLKNTEGIAIKSTVGRLKAGLEWHGYHQIHIGMVKYINYETDRFEHRNNFLLPFVHKRLSFEHEKEIRALILHIQNPSLDLSGGKDVFNPYIECDLDALIDSIYVAPKMASWYRDLVKYMLTMHNLDKEVLQSSLDDEAVI